jgi:hypothetical protein
LMTARYCEASDFNSVRQPASGTCTCSKPSANSTAQVRWATAFPQTSGHATMGPWPSGTRRRLPATIFSKDAPACSRVRSIGKPNVDFSIQRYRENTKPALRAELRRALVSSHSPPRCHSEARSAEESAVRRRTSSPSPKGLSHQKQIPCAIPERSRGSLVFPYLDRATFIIICSTPTHLKGTTCSIF